MAIGDDKVRLQVIVDREVAEEIQRLAKAMGASVSQMAGRLLVAAVEDNAFMIKYVFGPVQQLRHRFTKRKSTGETPEKG